jgi:hypothetical protein
MNLPKNQVGASVLFQLGEHFSIEVGSYPESGGLDQFVEYRLGQSKPSLLRIGHNAEETHDCLEK